MSGDLRTLYQREIMAHHNSPHNRGVLENATHRAECDNPLCGDRISVSLLVYDGAIQEVRFDGIGCALSIAAASMMTDAVSQQPVGDVQRMAAAVRAVLENTGHATDWPASLVSFSAVEDYPSRKPCVALAWEALQSALSSKYQSDPGLPTR